MKRIIIIGSSGSGKSTLARELGAKLQLPVIHLDKHFWHSGWVETPHNKWVAKMKELVKGEEWIIDGNYRSTLEIRLKKADTVIFLDMPRWLCIWRAVKRRIQYMNQPRPDMASGCEEKLLDPELPQFLRWIWDYPNRARTSVVQRLNNMDANKRLVWLRSSSEVKCFLDNPYHPHPRFTLADDCYKYMVKRNL